MKKIRKISVTSMKIYSKQLRIMKDAIDNWIRSIDWKFGKFSTLPIFFGVVMASFDIVMMSVAKMVSLKQISYNIGLPIAAVIYSIQPYFFMKALNYENMVVTNLVWNLVSDIIVTLQGVFIFGESIAGLRWIAICMSIVSLTIFAYTESN